MVLGLIVFVIILMVIFLGLEYTENVLSIIWEKGTTFVIDVIQSIKESV